MGFPIKSFVTSCPTVPLGTVSLQLLRALGAPANQYSLIRAAGLLEDKDSEGMFLSNTRRYLPT